MKIYFDESEDGGKKMLLLGATFIYNESSVKSLKSKIDQIKANHSFYRPNGIPKEIKYTRVAARVDYMVGKEAIDAFFGNPTTYFRCCVIRWNNKDLMKIGGKGDPLPLRKAILYTRLTQYLLSRGLNEFRNAVLLYDELVRCKQDKFEEIIENKFGYVSVKNRRGLEPRIKTTKSISSQKEINNTVQVTDLLVGCVLNSNFPTVNGRKNAIRNYLAQQLGKKNLKRVNWPNSLLNLNKADLNIKFDIDYLDIGDFVNNNAKRPKSGKSRSK